MITDNRTQKRRTGDRGEEHAVGMLTRDGYRIAERNFSCKTGELDIVAVQPEEGVLAFVEVKTRHRLDYGLPCQAVGPDKQRRLKRSAQVWMMLHPDFSGLQPRMDIIEILCLGGQVYGRHLKNAF